MAHLLSIFQQGLLTHLLKRLQVVIPIYSQDSIGLNVAISKERDFVVWIDFQGANPLFFLAV